MYERYSSFRLAMTRMMRSASASLLPSWIPSAFDMRIRRGTALSISASRFLYPSSSSIASVSASLGPMWRGTKLSASRGGAFVVFVVMVMKVTLPSMRWRFFVTRPADGTYNMALDEALMRRAAQTGTATFRVYSWSVPTLSLGRNQRARDSYDEDVAKDLGVRFVRRPTGGRALLHHREVTYSATLPLADAGDARECYDFINGVLLAALARLGVD